MSFNNDYVILEELGHGAMATVVKATQRSLDRPVAIKRILPHLAKDADFVGRFEREAKASAHLKHTNVLQIIDFGRDEEGVPFIVMELMDGPTLEQLLGVVDKLPLDVALSIVIQVLGGLDHAHSNGVVHRDIKPANLMLSATGVAKITDFGIAQAAALPSITMAGMRIGTPLYMSPEQAAGRAIDHRSDLFSVGTVLYQILTGKLPFTGDTGAVFYKVIHEDAAPIRQAEPDLAPALADIVEKALQKDVTRRFFDAAEFAYALETAAFELGLRVGPRVVRDLLQAKMGVAASGAQVPKPATSGRRIRTLSGSLGPRPRAAFLPLQGCFGCQVNLLDLHERIGELAAAIDVRYSCLMDVKEVPEVDLLVVEGCVANSENEERLRAARARCTTLVALGSCACFGGVPGLRNLFPLEQVLERSYDGSLAAKGADLPKALRLPTLLPKVRAVQDVVDVEATIPGCPAPPQLVVQSLLAVIEGKTDTHARHNLCHECPRQRREMVTPQRKLVADDVVPLMSLESIDPHLCFLEQGVPCMGLTTRVGCGARCMGHNVPCHGCMGPAQNARETGAKWIDAAASLLPSGQLRIKHDLVGSAYRYTAAISVLD